jgi:hypothetical protein
MTHRARQIAPHRFVEKHHRNIFFAQVQDGLRLRSRLIDVSFGGNEPPPNPMDFRPRLRKHRCRSFASLDATTIRFLAII